MGGREIEGVVVGDDDVGQLKGADRGRGRRGRWSRGRGVVEVCHLLIMRVSTFLCWANSSCGQTENNTRAFSKPQNISIRCFFYAQSADLFK